MAKLRMESSLDPSGFKAGLKEIQSGVGQLNTQMSQLSGLASAFGVGLGLGSIGAGISELVNMFGESAKKARELALGAEALEIPANVLDSWQELFEMMGSSGEQVTSFFGRLESSREAAIAGNEKMAASFEKIGISIEDLTKLNIEDLAKRVAESAAGSGMTGEASLGIEAIAGKMAKSPAFRRALMAMGEGKTTGVRTELDPGTAEWLLEQERASQAGKKSRSNWRANFMRQAGGLFGLSDAVMRANEQSPEEKAADEAKFAAWQREMGVTAAPQLTREQQRAQARERAESNKAAIAAENARHASAVTGMQMDEIEKGVHSGHTQVDAFTRRGLVSGGGAFDTAAYALARRQMEVERLQTLALDRNTKALEEKNRHDAAMKRLKSGASVFVGGGGDAEPEVE